MRSILVPSLVILSICLTVLSIEENPDKNNPAIPSSTVQVEETRTTTTHTESPSSPDETTQHIESSETDKETTHRSLNVCYDEILKTANHSYVWKILQRYGPQITPKRKYKRKEIQELIASTEEESDVFVYTDKAFEEASWCHQNAQWVTYLFVGERIQEPLVTYTNVRDLFMDIKKDHDDGVFNSVYLCTVPRILKAPNAPKDFFYRTHWFVIQSTPGFLCCVLFISRV
eukprot:TRINITY_DN341_c0_g2_i2.p1 TRINITY_DN341_c0_g2~~TRINITY_DN341_c0_g2_i2.p1  ORF type:complete len:230 (+),score=37.05 TRINITY_DN341_c0_g2_i2:1454-2143(+)